MDTPLNPAKAPRRKLKRVLRKNKINSSFSHNSSSHSLYQKKLKTAINTSLNLSSNVRTLQANNRSLALQVARLREEQRRVFNEHMNLLQHNHHLNERILELERQLDMAPSIIDHEVHSRCQAKVQNVQAHLDLLLESASIFTKGLTELKEVWTVSPRKSGNSVAALSFRRSTRSSRGVDSAARPAYYPSFSPEERGVTSINDEDDEGLLQSPGVSERAFSHDISTVNECSFLENQPVPPAVHALQEDILEEEKSFACSMISCSPRRRLVSGMKKEHSIPALDRLSRGENLMAPMVTVRRSDRRNTYRVTEAKSPTQNEQRETRSPTIKGHETLMSLTSPKIFASPQKDKALITSKTVSNTESPSKIGRAFQGNRKGGVSTSSSCKTNRIEDLKSPPLRIRNEFGLMTAHEEWLKKTESNSDKETRASLTPKSPCGETTSYSLEDMELTTGIHDEPLTQIRISPKIIPPGHSDKYPVDGKASPKRTLKTKTVNSLDPETKSSLPILHNKDEHINRNDTEKCEPTASRSRGRQTSGKNSEDTSSDTEASSVPEAVSMRVAKGGKLVFAVSRKGADGSRAAVHTSIRARSKPKKVLTALDQTIAQPSAEDVQNIFDFHDKTPKSLQQNNHQISMSVFSITADESAFSPLGPLNKLRESMKDKDVTSKEGVLKEKEQPVVKSKKDVPKEKEQPVKSKERVPKEIEQPVKRSKERVPKEIEQPVKRSKERVPKEIEQPVKRSKERVPKEKEQPLIRSKERVPKEKEQLVSDKGSTISSPVVERSRSRSRSVFRSRSRSRKKNIEEQDVESVDLQCKDKDQDETNSGLSQPNLIEKPACGLSPQEKGIASTFVGEVYMAPLKGSPEVRPRYRTRSQSRGRRRKSGTRQSPESAKKVRSKSAAFSGSPPPERSRSRGRPKGRGQGDSNVGTTDSINQRFSPSKDDLPVSEEKTDYTKLVPNNALCESPIPSTRKSRPPQSPGATETTRRSRSRSTVRIPRSRDRSQIASVEEKNQPIVCDFTGKEGGDATSRNVNKETHKQPAGDSEIENVQKKIDEEKSSSHSKTKYGNETRTINGTQVNCVKQDSEKGTHSPSSKDGNIRCGSTKDGIRQEVKTNSTSPGRKSRKEMFNKLSKLPKKDLKESATSLVNQPSPTRRLAAEEQGEETTLKRRLVSSREKSIHRKQTEEASGASLSADTYEISNGKKDDQTVARHSPESISLRLGATEPMQVSSPSFVGDCHANTQPQSIGKCEKATIKPGSLLKSDDQKVSSAVKLGIKSHPQQDCGDKNFKVSDHHGSDGLQAGVASPTRVTSSKQRQKKVLKSVSKKTKKLQEQALEKDNPTQDNEAGNNLDVPGSEEDDVNNRLPTAAPVSTETLGDGNHRKSSLSEEEDVEIKTGTSSSILNQGPKNSKIVKTSSNLFNFAKDTESHSPNREGRKRRAATNVSYVAPPLNSKLRRGDPFTSHYAAEAISIYRSPKSKAKEKAKLRRDVLGSLSNMTIKEDPSAADGEEK
ncbi:hypothetical protein EGW08_015440 [Elysia chlorotica]|uniref:Shugoshin C-terminal domain-containing protein n=1 Tax=Elysia chlorotica TaxID=188477 RepID=A0A3S1B7C5_ELYCH|nr:hypothetical protein EGW08_015440 [Elysia chlorotica]